MQERLDLTILIPVHSVSDDNFLEYFNKAVNSVINSRVRPSNLTIVRCACKDVRATLEDSMSNGVLAEANKVFDVSIVENEVGKSYQTMINEGAKTVETKWFSVLEFDDEYSDIYFKNFREYSKQYDEVEFFTPIISEVDSKGEFKDLTNVAVWSAGFNDDNNDLGFIIHETLMEYEAISTNGMIITTEAFKEVGGLKPTIKFSFNYEFLLRLTNKGIKAMVIPKVGYKHTNMREGSLFWSYKNGEDAISEDEAKFWLSTARKEFRTNLAKVIEYNT